VRSGFAVIATTLVLMAVFVPISFMSGDTVSAVREFGVTVAAAVGFSAFVALSLTPMMTSRLFASGMRGRAWPAAWTGCSTISMIVTRQGCAGRSLASAPCGSSAARWACLRGAGIAGAGMAFSALKLSNELTPQEDRGFVRIS
jgi:multidrug efflux pump